MGKEIPNVGDYALSGEMFAMPKRFKKFGDKLHLDIGNLSSVYNGDIVMISMKHEVRPILLEADSAEAQALFVWLESETEIEE